MQHQLSPVSCSCAAPVRAVRYNSCRLSLYHCSCTGPAESNGELMPLPHRCRCQEQGAGLLDAVHCHRPAHLVRGGTDRPQHESGLHLRMALPDAGQIHVVCVYVVDDVASTAGPFVMSGVLPYAGPDHKRACACVLGSTFDRLPACRMDVASLAEKQTAAGRDQCQED